MSTEPREESLSHLFDDARERFLDTVCATADWRAPPHDVLSEVHKQLAAFDLEVVTYATGSDFYAWTIQRRTEETA